MASRLRDYRLDENALDELAYRAETILTANPRMTPSEGHRRRRSHEDPAFRSRCMAWFEPSPYKSSNFTEA